MSRKFWNWLKNEQDRTLYLDGYIAEDSWFDDDITPRQFKAELYSSDGNVTIMLNSPGGDVFAASQIYTMLKEYPGRIVVKIEGIAASAATVIAMAADEIYISPVAMMMIHNPATIVFGEVSDLQSGIAMLSEVKESIINAYAEKTGLSRAKISHMMDAESWFNAWKAVELGFADKVLYTTEDNEPKPPSAAFLFDKITVTNALARKLPREPESQTEPQTMTPLSQLEKRLTLLQH
ncbi:MAG: head maturation protease, ClpP-related [Acidobacteriota bacterium]